MDSFQIHSLVQVGCKRVALSPQQQWISSLPDRRSVRTLPQSAPRRNTSVMSAAHYAPWSALPSVLHSALDSSSRCPNPNPQSRWSSTLWGSQRTWHCSTCLWVGEEGWQEGKRDANMRTFGLPAKQRWHSLQHGMHSFGNGRRPAVCLGNKPDVSITGLPRHSWFIIRHC